MGDGARVVEHLAHRHRERRRVPQRVVADAVTNEEHGDVRLGEQDIHVPGHATGNGMNSVLDGHPSLLERIGQFAYGVLRLRGRHPVTRHEHDLLRVSHLHRDIVEAAARRKA